MKRAKLVLVLSLVLTFAAGVALGFLAPRAPGGGHRPRSPSSWLGDELKLSPEQREEMRAIWSEVVGSLHGSQREERRLIAERRDAAIVGLLSDDQKVEYERILTEYEAAQEQLSADRRAAFERAVERTKQILTAEQRVLYEEKLKSFPARDREGSRGPGGSRYRPGGGSPRHGRPDRGEPGP